MWYLLAKLGRIVPWVFTNLRVTTRLHIPTLTTPANLQQIPEHLQETNGRTPFVKMFVINRVSLQEDPKEHAYKYIIWIIINNMLITRC